MKMSVAYLRVSTEAQTEKFGLDMQKEKILDYCGKEGVEIGKWYIDGGYSGSNLQRPKIQELLTDAETGIIDKVYIYKLDRMSRDVIDTLDLLYRVLPKYGVEIVSMTEDLRFENPMDKVMIGVNAIMGQYEREMIYMRTRAGMKERIKKGYWMGGGRVPFGYYYDRNDGILHPKEDEAQTVRTAFNLFIDGYSCDKIQKILGFKTEVLVRNLLRRKTYIGCIKYNGEEYKGMHEPIVDEYTFYAAQECIKKRHTNAHINNDNMLTGLLRCGVCGARMRYQKWGKYHKVVCYSQNKGKDYMVKNPDCDNPKRKAQEIEELVENEFKEFLIDLGREENDNADSKVNVIEDSIKKTNAKIKKLYNLYVDNPSDNLMDIIKEEEGRIAELKKELEQEKSNTVKKDNSVKVEEIKRIGDVWDSLTNREKNKLLKECVDKIVINRDSVEVHFIIF